MSLAAGRNKSTGWWSSWRGHSECCDPGVWTQEAMSFPSLSHCSFTMRGCNTTTWRLAVHKRLSYAAFRNFIGLLWPIFRREARPLPSNITVGPGCGGDKPPSRQSYPSWLAWVSERSRTRSSSSDDLFEASTPTRCRLTGSRRHAMGPMTFSRRDGPPIVRHGSFSVIYWTRWSGTKRSVGNRAIDRPS
jgi:hypothetical protein